jgi:hypothetical protein
MAELEPLGHTEHLVIDGTDTGPALLYGGQAERPDPLAEPQGYGQKRAWMRPWGTRDEFCAWDRAGPSAPPSCKRLWAQRWTLGCVHEHVQDIDLCDEHAEKLTGVRYLLVCGYEGCGERVLVGKVTDPDGNALPLPSPPREQTARMQAAIDSLDAEWQGR